MQSLDDDEKRLVLGEVLADQLQAILEYVQDIPEIKVRLTHVEQDVAVLKTDVAGLKLDVYDLKFDVKGLKLDVKEIRFDVSTLKSDMKSVKTILKDHGRQFNQTDKRLTKLESAA